MPMPTPPTSINTIKMIKIPLIWTILEPIWTIFYSFHVSNCVVFIVLKGTPLTNTPTPTHSGLAALPNPFLCSNFMLFFGAHCLLTI